MQGEQNVGWQQTAHTGRRFLLFTSLVIVGRFSPFTGCRPATAVQKCQCSNGSHLARINYVQKPVAALQQQYRGRALPNNYATATWGADSPAAASASVTFSDAGQQKGPSCTSRPAGRWTWIAQVVEAPWSTALAENVKTTRNQQQAGRKGR